MVLHFIKGALYLSNLKDYLLQYIIIKLHLYYKKMGNTVPKVNLDEYIFDLSDKNLIGEGSYAKVYKIKKSKY